MTVPSSALQRGFHALAPYLLREEKRMPLQVTCINKEDRYGPHEHSQRRRTQRHGTRWRLSLEEAIAGILEGRYSLGRSRSPRHRDLAEHEACKHPKTVADGYSPDNLLSLAKCR